ncbi:MAG: hypothetical protein HYZ31_02735 [Gammaproteobacteria bacterium]|nr:hypothetical protein [Gammaproteobacteria bacterium]
MLMRAYLVVFAMLLVVLQGCVAVQTFPTAARSGDTITLAVGSPDGMTRANTTAQFTSPSLANPINLPIRSIIKLRPDNTSFIGAFDEFVSNIPYSSSHSAWLSMIVIDLPVGLPVGAATINVATSGIYYPGQGASVNTTPISIEVLPGTGSPNKFMYNPNGYGVAEGDLTDLESLPQVVVRPPLASAWEVEFAAAEIKVSAPSRIKSTGLPIPLNHVKVIADDMSIENSAHQMQMFWTRTGDDYTVNFVNQGHALTFQTRFSIVLYPYSDYEFTPGMVPAVTSVTYYDTSGNVMSSMPTASSYQATLE